MRRLPPCLLLCAVGISLAACGTAVAPDAGTDQPAPGSSAGASGATSDDARRYTATATVLESPDHGPQLCLGGVADSLPPQCSGPDLLGWDWDAVDAAESANGTTWGSYSVTGTYDGTSFTLTEPAGPPVAPSEQPVEHEFSTPCPAPDGGWAVVDQTTATDAGLQAALGVAAAADGYAGAWVDQSFNATQDPSSSIEETANDPAQLILNVATAGDLAALERDLRAVWGGALCVSTAPRSEAELLTILDAVITEPGVLGGGPNPREGTVEIQVIAENGLQERMDAAYGPGVVTVTAALQAVD